METKKTLSKSIILSLKLIFGLAILALVLILLSFIFSFKHWQQFTKEALAGQESIKIGINYLMNKDFKGASVEFTRAKENLERSKQELESLQNKWIAAKFVPGRNQLNYLSNLNDSALIISRSAAQVSNLAINLSSNSFIDTNDFNSLSTSQKSSFIQSIIVLEPELNALKANISLALIKLNSIPRYSVLWPIRNKLNTVKEQLTEAHWLLGKTMPIVRLLPAFSGYPEPAHYLIMLQNNDELRPSGGFLGSYVRLDVSNFGEIDKLEASDIYHLDMPSIGKTKFTAPLPITTYLKVKNWYLRDANWSPDWPTSAKQIQTMFHEESLASGIEEPPMDAIIAITPEFVANLLRITGPITVKGETYAPENMQALLQYNVEVAYLEEDISSWDRKDIINDLIYELKNRLSKLSLKQYPLILEKITESINKKDLLIYFNNPHEQVIAQDLEASGEVAKNHDDFLMVVDANLAAFKSDAVITKNIFYKLDSTKKGLIAQTKLNYRHNSGFDWRTTRYRSFTRIYAPLGSKLINIDGLKSNETDITIFEDKELNKQVFGFFWSIEPGSSRELTINYSLPSSLQNKIKEEKQYQLLVQRQPGSRIERISIAIDLEDEIEQIIPDDTFNEKKATRAYWTSDLDKDKKFIIINK